MAKIIFKRTQILSAAFLVLGAVFLGSAARLTAQTKTNERTQDPAAAPTAPRTGQRREDNKKPPDTTHYFYEFTQPDFEVRHIVIEHDATGRGKITFERKDEEGSIDEPINL